MEFEITRDRRNELLLRREIDFNLRFNGPTPSRMQITGKLSALLNVNEKMMVLGGLKTRFGQSLVTGSARVYDTEDQKTRVEPAHLMARGKPKPKEEGA